MSVGISVQLYVAKSAGSSWRSGRVSCALHYGTLKCLLLGCVTKNTREEHKEGSVGVTREVNHLITSNSYSNPTNQPIEVSTHQITNIAKTQINDYVRWSSRLKQHINCEHTHLLNSSPSCISPFSCLSVPQSNLFTCHSIWASIWVNVRSDQAWLS